VADGVARALPESLARRVRAAAWHAPGATTAAQAHVVAAVGWVVGGGHASAAGTRRLWDLALPALASRGVLALGWGSGADAAAWQDAWASTAAMHPADVARSRAAAGGSAPPCSAGLAGRVGCLLVSIETLVEASRLVSHSRAVGGAALPRPDFLVAAAASALQEWLAALDSWATGEGAADGSMAAREAAACGLLLAAFEISSRLLRAAPGTELLAPEHGEALALSALAALRARSGPLPSSRHVAAARAAAERVAHAETRAMLLGVLDDLLVASPVSEGGVG
jgi:hypothetical protein